MVSNDTCKRAASDKLKEAKVNKILTIKQAKHMKKKIWNIQETTIFLGNAHDDKKVLFWWSFSYEGRFSLRFPYFSLYLRFHHRRRKKLDHETNISVFSSFHMLIKSLDPVKTTFIQQRLLSKDGQELGEGSARLLICTSVALDQQVRKPALMAVHYTWARVTCAGDDSSLPNALIVDSSLDVSRINDFSPC